MNIAILGATGHIAKSIIYSFKDEPNILLHLFTRSVDKTKAFAQEIGLQNAFINTYTQFNDFAYSSIINCVGIGDPARLKSHPDEVFFVTEEIDLLAITYLKSHPETTYINFSSGAVYGTEFNQPASLTTKTIVDVNNIVSEDYYRIAKLNSEAKHRSLNDFNIIDLRIFGYYSRFIDLTKNYLMTDILSSIKENRTLKTSPNNIIRDYVHPVDLANLVKKCFEAKKINVALDVKSKKPISKKEILNFFKQKYNLKFDMIEDFVIHSATGEKLNYYSENKNTEPIKFKPKYTSIESISMETEEYFKLFS